MKFASLLWLLSLVFMAGSYDLIAGDDDAEDEYVLFEDVSDDAGEDQLEVEEESEESAPEGSEGDIFRDALNEMGDFEEGE